MTNRPAAPPPAAPPADEVPEDESRDEPTEAPEAPDTRGAGGSRFDAANQQVVRADGSGPARGPATSAQAGTPGTWLPAGSYPPAGVAALQTSGITAVPATAWTQGQFVQTATTGAPGRATWTGTGWVGGVAP